MGTLEVILGDITRIPADVIVNAANQGLMGGGGVDGAIHRAGGPAIMEARRLIGHCPTGSAVITTAGNLPATYVIHAVAPRYSGKPRDAELLRGAYSTSLALARDHELRTIAFPSLGTGAYGYPIDEAAPLAIAVARQHLAEPTSLERIVFVTFSERDLSAYRSALDATQKSRCSSD